MKSTDMESNPKAVTLEDINPPAYCQVCCGVYTKDWIGHYCPNKCIEAWDPLVHGPIERDQRRPRQVCWQLEKGEVRERVITSWLLGGQEAACLAVKAWLRGNENAFLSGM